MHVRMFVRTSICPPDQHAKLSKEKATGATRRASSTRGEEEKGQPNLSQLV